MRPRATPGCWDRLEHLVEVFWRCQAAGGDGYVGGVPGGRALGEELAAGTVDADLFTLNGRWVPLYNLHKTFAGLLDAYTYAASGRALAIATALADWWLGISSHIPDRRLRRDPAHRIRRDERCLRHPGGHHRPRGPLGGGTPLLPPRPAGPLAEGRDELDGLHANTQIPKVVGYARLAAATGRDAVRQSGRLLLEHCGLPPDGLHRREQRAGALPPLCRFLRP